MRVAFVAVNYNNCRVSINYCSNVLSIRRDEDITAEVVIVDNASNEEDYHELVKETDDYQDVTVVRSPENTGYFGGLNYGLSHLDLGSYDYIVAGNNDLFFERDFLVKLKEKCYNSRDTVIVPDVETIGGIHQNPQYINPPSKKRILGMDIYYSCYPASVLINLLWGFKRKQRRDNRKVKQTASLEIFLCTGALFILTPAFFEHCGKFDDSLFLWGEEAALAHQLYEAGDKMLYDPELHVTHMENATVGVFSSRKKYLRSRRSYKIYRNYLLVENDNRREFQ